MRRLILTRIETSDQGTLGILTDEDYGKICYTLEPPWRDNAKGLSCVRLGEYECKLFSSKRFGRVYILQEVEGDDGREAVLIHSGNLAGDVTKGYMTHSQGCILVGSKVGILEGQRAVLASKPALSKLMRELNEEAFILKIDAVRRES